MIVSYEVYKHVKHPPPALMKWWLGLAVATWVLFKLRGWLGRRIVHHYDRSVISSISGSNIGIPQGQRGRFARVKTKYE